MKESVSMHNPITEAAQGIASEAPSTGGPLKLFESVGRDAFITLLEHGLRSDHRLLDLGCGALRLGYWLVRFLDAGRYFGIEPEPQMLKPGLKYALGEDIVKVKQPSFSDNATFDFSVFSTKFDYVLARSIITHTTAAPTRKIIEQFKLTGRPGAIMMASYWPTAGTFPPGGVIGDELPLDDWRFIQIVKYDFSTIARWAEAVGVQVSEWAGRPPINGQVWLKFQLD